VTLSAAAAEAPPAKAPTAASKTPRQAKKYELEKGRLARIFDTHSFYYLRECRHSDRMEATVPLNRNRICGSPGSSE
jgi:hypothetical protein